MCRLCDVFQKLKNNDIWDSILFESDNFYVIPSLGSMVEGWLLICSKDHFLSMSTLGASRISELESFTSYLKSYLNESYGSISLFEHGPDSNNLTVGCGVDHFHLHLVPTNGINLLKESNQKHPEWKWSRLTFLEELPVILPNSMSYLFLETEDGQRYMTCNDTFESQYFRKLIADCKGMSDNFDWKECYMLENIVKTISTIKVHKHAELA